MVTLICVANAKEHLTINDYGVVVTFEQENVYWVQMIKDQFLQNWNM